MPDPHFQRAVLRVPATSANMGPGFDCIGIAVDVWNETEVWIGNGSIDIAGEGEDSLPRDGGNLLISSAEKAFHALGVEPLPLSFRCFNSIPCARGLGSSSAATVTGVAAAYIFAGIDVDDPDTRSEIFNIAAQIEGHPDNAAPAVFGACQIGIHADAGLSNRSWLNQRIDLSDNLKVVVYVPDFEMNTSEARAVLSAEVPRTDAVFNVGRAALLSYALSNGKWDLLRHATQDRLHQPQRIESLFPLFKPIARAALEAGAHGVFLSGAGPAIMALATDRVMTICYEMTENARKAQIEGRSLILDIAPHGLDVEIHV